MNLNELWLRLKNLGTATADLVDRLLGNTPASAKQHPAPQAIPVEASPRRRRES